MPIKIKLTKNRAIPIIDENFKEPIPNKDYIISLLVSRVSKESYDSNGEEEEDTIYKMEIMDVKYFQELGDSKKIEVKHGQTPSQNLRWIIESKLDNEGLGNEDDTNYEKIINIIAHQFLKQYSCKYLLEKYK